MTTVAIPELGSLTEDEIAQLWHASGGTLDLDLLTAELDRREQTERRSAAAREAARARHAEWETAAYAQYQAASAYCNGDHNMLSAAGKRQGRDAWPMCWERNEQDARKLASDELLTYWDWESPRVPSPGQYATAKRDAAAEQKARAAAEPMSAAEAAELAASAPRPAVAPIAPGAIARWLPAITAAERHVNSLAARLEARLAALGRQ